MFEQVFGAGGVDRPYAPEGTWSDPSTAIAFNLGVGHMRENLLAGLMAGGSGRIQVESMMTAIGALAGFAAQHAIRETIVRSGRLPEHGGSTTGAGAFIVVSMKDGSRYFLGELLNSYLVRVGKEAAPLGPGNCTLWNLVAAAVQSIGKQPTSFETISRIFTRTAMSLGDSNYGVPDVPDQHRPQVLPRQALDLWWRMTRELLSFEGIPPLAGKPLTPGLWPAVLGLVAQTFLMMGKDTLDPEISMRLLFEAAIPMSKVDPATVPGAT